ncbi:uncharacterized protein [Parasteatoda tepidariorum]|uniref:uncharacterized protein n=1 Tax=Parasteatoda tepidariorum TaxID=114398 RepID=UPI001C722C6D|nr:uncharacterized protein LOC107452305 [Parasteatoda tepidariorum]XP_015924175.2 uncharacterized protein LOC107452305 [Parasteatoda tepidariorum]XP_015924176.2 uncharacterized protein LOC107452305 [Parasteatoda tepidariorum]XP_015924177.2 uncharacterized protein LOC107452305 [Parasteatoda tepidariorum]XP_015924178.2 uncharacterized protein LOC107452305 [Parasteatoda tepidariorum]XP_015924179.2 uncharacterized protein LOC107452305 [Parasteatoda tepidariorum]XP_015924180.2 uncharacterized prot
METQTDLLKSLEIVQKDVYYKKVFRDLYNRINLLKCTNGYVTKGLPDLDENFINQQSIFDFVHFLKIEQWNQIYEYLQSKKCQPENVSHLLVPLKQLIEEYSNITKFPSDDAKAELVLDTIFEIGKKCKDFTLEEKREIAESMVHCLQPIKTYIETISSLYRTRLDCYILQRRSALQFLVEDYAQFPVGDTILLIELEKANVKESIEILDDIIEDYRDISDSSDCESDYESAGASRMPHSHSWWSK